MMGLIYTRFELNFVPEPCPSVPTTIQNLGCSTATTRGREPEVVEFYGGKSTLHYSAKQRRRNHARVRL